MKQQIANILSKDMDRGEFLRYIGFAFIAVLGISSVLSALARFDESSSKTSKTGYGGSPYGS